MIWWERPNAVLQPEADCLNEILKHVEQLFKLYTHVYQKHEHNYIIRRPIILAKRR